MRSRPRSPRSSRGQPSHPRFQDLPQPRSGERESFEGHHREHYYRHRDTIRGHNPRITCHNCGEKGHIARQCPNQDYRQEVKITYERRSQNFDGASFPQSSLRSPDYSRNRDTDFRDNEQHFQSREDDKRSEVRLPESLKMQGDAYRKNAEQIQMEKSMGFSSFHESTDKYFDEQSTVGSVKAGFSTSIKEEKIESSEVKQEFKLAKGDFNQTLDFANKIEFTDNVDIKPKLEIKEEKRESSEVKKEFKLAKRDSDQILHFMSKIEFTDYPDIKPKLEIKEQNTGNLELKIEIKKELKKEIKEELLNVKEITDEEMKAGLAILDSLDFKKELKKEKKEESMNVKEETDDEMKTGLAVLDTLDFDTRRDTDNCQKLYHESRKQHKCTICDLDYFGHQDLKHHVIAFHAHNMRIHKCSLCDEDFSKKVSIKHHIANAHEGKGKKMYKCLSCENKFFKISDMNIHFADIHERKGPMKCPLCEKVFSQKKSFGKAHCP